MRRPRLAPSSPSSASAVAALAVLAVACGGAPAAAPSPKQVDASHQILGARAEGTPAELVARGERALLEERWRDAVDAFEALLAAEPGRADASILHGLGVALEHLGERARARDRFREVSARFPDDALVPAALAREASLAAYLEDWKGLGEIAGRVLTRAERDKDPVGTMLGLGARGLARVQEGDLARATRDVTDGLDLVDQHHYGAENRLPVPVAQLKFAHGEVRRVRSEAIELSSDDPPRFVVDLERRCQGLLDAQGAYADAIRSVDPHWAAMSGVRVGEMYRALHTHLMKLPPPPKAKTEKDRQLFFGIMHVRYRVLLEKGLEMMKRTLALAEKTGDDSAWITRAARAREDMERALEDEKAQIAQLPFTEPEIEQALARMKKNAAAEAEKRAR